MAEAKLLDQAQTPAKTRYYPWQWHDQPVTVAYDLQGDGPPVLLLPALSSISTRAEFNAVAARLAQHYQVITLDWPGFGASDRPAWRTRPAIYHALLKDFVQDIVPGLAGLVAAGHSAGYTLTLATDKSVVPHLQAIALVAPTWRGPLPTAMGNHRWAYSLLRWLVWCPVVGQALYALNAHPAFLRWMMGRHVYSNAAHITPGLIQAKHQTTQAKGARFASAAFVTGGLDPVQQRTDWLDLVQAVTVPKLVIVGQQSPPKSKAEMERLSAMAGVESAMAPGSLGLGEEYSEEALAILLPFLAQHLGH